VYNLSANETKRLTTNHGVEAHASVSPDGKWLYFISERTFNNSTGSPWGSRQPEPYYDKTDKIYAIALYTSAVFPFREATEHNTIKPDSSKTETVAKKTKADKKKKKAEDKIDLNDMGSRLYEVPMKASNIADFGLNSDWIYWSVINRDDRKVNLNALKMTNKKNNEVVNIASPISNFILSGDGKKLLIRDKNGIVVLNADSTKPDAKKNSVDLTKWAFTIDSVEDWKQMHKDAWRMERDYFYDKNMHGVDWQSVYDLYLPQVDRVTDRYKLDYILANMISELSALHMFVYGGDIRSPDDKISNGYLGAILSHKDPGDGWKIDHIYRSHPDFPEELSPLAKPHLKIKEGDLILAINGMNTAGLPDINELLVNKADVQVRLKLKNTKGETYENDFVKNFYPGIGKEGLIIDVRHNRGGNIDSWILDKLLRKAWFYWAPRVGLSSPNMQYAFTGHLVVLMDERTASDGEAFSEGFRRLGLGKLIGVRTWGGEIWLSSGNRLVDNGIATAAGRGSSVS
jgi:tricorn protease